MDNLKGMGWMTLAMLGFALADTFIKLSLITLPIGQVIAFFGIGGALVYGLWTKARGERLFEPTLFRPAFWLRLCSEVLSTVCFVTALDLIDLSLMAAIIQANPLLVTLGAALFLGADVGWKRWLAIAIGLFGVLIIVRPGMAGFDVNSLWAVGATLGLVGRDLATRMMPREVSNHLLSAWGFVAVGLSGLIILGVSREFVMPEGTAWAFLVGALLSALVAYYTITAAMRVGEIAVVTPFRYTRLVFALILALLVFGERPDLWTLVGAGIVIGTGLYTLWRERKVTG
ncbi:EamA family transporter [Rhodobacterales bacterium HKCCE4037]|nr:EamA family transporter [Rhodobacterales bacterium HKCCE4037]